MRRSAGISRRGLAGALAFAPSGLFAAEPRTAEAIHRRVLTLDSHVDVALPGLSAPPQRASLAQLRAGGVDAVVLAVFAPTGPPTPEGHAAGRREAMTRLAAIKALVRDNPGEADLALSAADVARIVAAGKVAVIISLLNADWLDGDVTEFDHLYAAGVRMAGLAHAGNTAFADSSRPQPGAGAPNGGLSALGRTAVQRLNDLGVLVDVSQLTPAGVFQTVQISRTPVVASHSAVRALADVPRNLSDAELDAIARAGGVVQVTPFLTYLVAKPATFDVQMGELRRAFGLPAGAGFEGVSTLSGPQQTAFQAASRKLYPPVGVARYVDHIDYIVRRVGIDHVGIGTDFNHGGGVVGFADESEAPNVTRELVARGYSEGQISRIWGGNFLRVLAAAEAARDIHQSR